ncbi:hypothetical protein ES702_02138 [subsurface metagenome]
MVNEESWRFEDQDNDLIPDEGCDYGLSEFCVDQFARETGCTINCILYLKSIEEMEKVLKGNGK